jgi:broad specificity phosphatase PhoE
MGTLYLVRHGQASFGADDYDRLSELGHRQSLRLGEHFVAQGLHFDAVICGTLRRHSETLQGIAQGMGLKTQALTWQGLNEYDSVALIEAIHPQPLERPDSPERVRHHFRLLRQGLLGWMAGTIAPRGMSSYADFVAGVESALDQVRACHQGQRVLIVSSGGPISTAVGQVLGTGHAATIELNLRLRNSSVTQFTFNPKRHALLSFNTLAHLDAAAYRNWVSYA